MLITILISAALGAALGFGSKTLIERGRRKRSTSMAALPVAALPETALPKAAVSEKDELWHRILRLSLPFDDGRLRSSRTELGGYAISASAVEHQGEARTCLYCNRGYRWLRQYVLVPVPEGSRDFGLTKAVDRALFCTTCGRIDERHDWDSDAKDMFEFVSRLERLSLKTRNERVKELSDFVAEGEKRLTAARAELAALAAPPAELTGPPYRPMLAAKNE